MTYLIMYHDSNSYWKTFTSDNLKYAIATYQSLCLVHDTVELYKKADFGFDFIIRGGLEHDRSRTLEDDRRNRARD